MIFTPYEPAESGAQIGIPLAEVQRVLSKSDDIKVADTNLFIINPRSNDPHFDECAMRQFLDQQNTFISDASCIELSHRVEHEFDRYFDSHEKDKKRLEEKTIKGFYGGNTLNLIDRIYADHAIFDFAASRNLNLRALSEPLKNDSLTRGTQEFKYLLETALEESIKVEKEHGKWKDNIKFDAYNVALCAYLAGNGEDKSIFLVSNDSDIIGWGEKDKNHEDGLVDRFNEKLAKRIEYLNEKERNPTENAEYRLLQKYVDDSCPFNKAQLLVNYPN